MLRQIATDSTEGVSKAQRSQQQCCQRYRTRRHAPSEAPVKQRISPLKTETSLKDPALKPSFPACARAPKPRSNTSQDLKTSALTPHSEPRSHCV
eukprot:1039613-Rhodomonas_salina.2